MAMVVLAILPGFGCSSTSYEAFETYYRHEPKFVLVVPVLNQSTDAEAARLFMSTICKPLVGRGYYVPPIELVSEVLAAEGVPDAALVRQVDPTKFHQYFGADAVLFVTIESWDTTYIVLTSSVKVAMNYRLVDCHTGQELWTKSAVHQRSSNTNAGGGLGGLIASTIEAAVVAATTDYVPLASEANYQALAALPPGVYNAAARTELLAKVAAWREAEDAKKAAEAAEAAEDS